jgi:hypothetical protein
MFKKMERKIDAYILTFYVLLLYNMGSQITFLKDELRPKSLAANISGVMCKRQNLVLEKVVYITFFFIFLHKPQKMTVFNKIWHVHI